MGQGQSNSESSRGGLARDLDIKTSYYELLAVERTATDEEIKKAYRRKALELHPDRNYGDVERTTRLFADVQAAYEVLSDPQERAWYDSHEDAILGNYEPGTDGESREAYDHSIGLTTADDINRLFRRFNSNIDFSDAPSGFYGFLRETFEQLAKEEQQAARKDGLEVPDYPSFGHRDDDYEDVIRAFYSYWNGFSTRKSFVWRDRYHATSDMDRFMRRAMEKENKKFRDEAIREFNAAVRSLVAFVRKRDPRYKPNSQSEAERQQALRNAVAAQKARARAENEAKLGDVDAVPQWAKVRDPEDLEDEEEEESDVEHFECIACRKTFKSEQQFEAHERSKKHLKAVQALRKKLEKEGKELDLQGTNGADDDDEEASAEPTREASPEPVPTADDLNDAYQSDKETDSEKDGKLDNSDHNISKSTQELNLNDPDSNEDESFEDEDDDDNDSDGETDLTSTLTPEPDQHPEKVTRPNNNNNTDNGDGNENGDDNDNIPRPPKVGKAAQKRAKKAASQHAATDDNYTCVTCKAAFQSRSRLFQHIEKFGHAAPVAATRNGGGKKRGKKR